jgi:non-ribosomal peptide synthase protein (TIGR01720 family)
MQQGLTALPATEFINGYGPTEVTTFSCTHRLRETAGESWEHGVPIGKPINNTESYVLDEQEQLLPVGVVGELYLGGAGVARGYVGDAAQTAERFVPHAYARREGERLYRTGDLVRWRVDGALEFMGRVDEQVKLRGYRIEPGEIEQALREHEAVQDAVVVVHADKEEKRLVAYVVTQAEAVSVSELRQHLRERLPDYMAPWSYEYLEHLPLNANGKVDRAALPEPSSSPRLTAEYVAPRTATEEVLCGIWSEVLRVERVGIHDNFFALGGDSILSIQIAARARQRGLQLSPKQLFQQQRISDLVSVVSEVETVQAAQGLVVGEVALTPIQQWFFEQEVPEPQHWNQALVLESSERLDSELLRRTWLELVAHHDGLRSRFRRSESGAWSQVIGAPAEADLGFASYDLRGLSREEQRRELEASGNEQQRQLDLEHGPLVRVCHYAVGEGRSWLLLIIHHLVVDGVSWRILLEDMEQVYGQLQKGEPIRLAAKSSSLVQWGRQLQEYASRSEVQAEAQYWLRVGAQQVARLPRDYEGGENLEGSAAQAVGRLNVEETQALLQEVPGRYQTEITEVLVLGLVEALWSWSGERLVRLALEGHGREEIGEAVEVTRTAGWFTSLYPALIDLRQVYELGAMLQTVKEQLRQIPRRGIGYGVLRYLGPNEEVREALREQAEPELSFNYLGQFDQVEGAGQWLRGAGVAGGAVHDPGGRRRYLLDVSSRVADGELCVTVQYSRAIHSTERMTALVNRYLAQLRRIIEHCRQQQTASYTPSDFPQAQLSQAELNKLMSKVSKAR